MPGLRPFAPLHRGQNRVDLARWGRRVVVAKSRRHTHHHRYAKEAAWLARARELGIPVPPLVATVEDVRGLHLLLPPAPPRHQAWRPTDWLHRLAPLHAVAPPPGWGPLRADGRPRWGDRSAAQAWYAERARRLDLDPAHLAPYWHSARPALIHGDVHRGNRAGDWILDWEQVAVADPLEEAARAALASGWGPPAWARAAGSDPDAPQWIAALTLAAVEAATTGGPRLAGARRWLAHRRR